MELKVHLGRSIILSNPVCAASGTFGYGQEMAKWVRLNRLGAIFTKAITLEPRLGNPPPRICEVTAGMLNAIGLANVGVRAFITEKMPFLRKLRCKIFVNVAGSTITEIVECIYRLNDCDGISGYELNLSCPNVKRGGIQFSTKPFLTQRATAAARKAASRLLIVKLSPNVTDIAESARAACDGGADVLSLINTLVGLSVDVENRRPRLSNITGGLSGPAIRPVGVAMTWKVRQALGPRVPLIGIGGITSARDALEYLIVGANAVQIGTGNFVDPRTAELVLNGIRDYLRSHRLQRLDQVTGTLQI